MLINANWQSDMKYLLMKKNVWEIVIEVEKLPVVKTDSDVTEKDVKDFHIRENWLYPLFI